MTALDVLSLEDAKSYLKVDFSDDDALIESLIKSAVGLVEQTTNYRLYRRNEVINTSKVGYTAFQFPLNSASANAMDSQGTYTVRQQYQALRTELFWGNGFGYINDYNQYFFNTDFYNLSGCNTAFTLTLDVGYTDTTLIPADLITAIQQIITFTYENRDLTNFKLPDNIMLLMQPYKRFVSLY
jgi:hypothetical protein